MRECHAATTIPFCLAHTFCATGSPSTVYLTVRAISIIHAQISAPSRLVMNLERNRDFIAPTYTVLRRVDHELDAADVLNADYLQVGTRQWWAIVGSNH